MYTLSLVVLCTASLVSVSASPGPGAEKPSASQSGALTSAADLRNDIISGEEITSDEERDFIDEGLDLVLGTKSGGRGPGAEKPSEGGFINDIKSWLHEVTLGDQRNFIDKALDLILGTKCLKVGARICPTHPPQRRSLFVIAMVVVIIAILLILCCCCCCCCSASSRRVITTTTIPI